MKKVGEIVKSVIVLIVSMWMILAMFGIMFMVVGSTFFEMGQSHCYSAEFAHNWGDHDSAVREMRAAAKDGLVGHRIAIVEYSMAQILLPWHWNEFAQKRANTIEQISKIKNDLQTTLAVA